MKEVVEKWISMVDYDLETAKAMYTTKRWLYVGFMCHQSIEKMLKGYWSAIREDDPPYKHNLLHLAELTGIAEMMNQKQRHFLNIMMPMNIEARYADYKDELFKSLTPEFCEKILIDTEALIIWIKNKL